MLTSPLSHKLWTCIYLTGVILSSIFTILLLMFLFDVPIDCTIWVTTSLLSSAELTENGQIMFSEDGDSWGRGLARAAAMVHWLRPRTDWVCVQCVLCWWWLETRRWDGGQSSIRGQDSFDNKHKTCTKWMHSFYTSIFMSPDHILRYVHASLFKVSYFNCLVNWFQLSLACILMRHTYVIMILDNIWHK